MNLITDGERSKKWIGYAKNKLAVLVDMFGNVNKRLLVEGYGLVLFALDDIRKIRISAPPGAVVVADVGGQYQYRYADQYGTDFATTMSRLPADGFSPRAVFSAMGELMYHGSSDYSVSLSLWGTLSGSWYAPRAVLPASLAEAGGYLAGHFIVSDTAPATTPTVGMGFTRNKTFYALSAVLPTELRSFSEFTLTAVRGGLAFASGLALSTTYTGFKGRAFCTRPVWGEDAALLFAFHGKGVCSDALGAAAVLVYRQGTAAEPFSNEGISLLGQVSQASIAAALGLAAPCSGGDNGSALNSAMTNLLGDDWPFSQAPHQRGMFSRGTQEVCCWGPVPGGAIKAVAFSASGSVTVHDMNLPTYDSAVYQPIITEVSPGFYVCELWDEPAFEFGDVFYGSPFTGWTKLDHPVGTIIRHRTIEASAAGIKALALVYDGAITTLHEYSGGAWAARGKAGDGQVTRADVALFGNHEFAHLAGMDSPVRRLWV